VSEVRDPDLPSDRPEAGKMCLKMDWTHSDNRGAIKKYSAVNQGAEDHEEDQGNAGWIVLISVQSRNLKHRNWSRTSISTEDCTRQESL